MTERPSNEARLRLYSARQAAEVLGLSVDTVRDLIRAGVIGTIRTGVTARAHRRIPAHELDRFVRAVEHGYEREEAPDSEEPGASSTP